MRNKIPLLILLFNFSNFFGQTPEAVLKDHPQILVNLAEPLKSLSPTPCFAERDKNTDENFKKQFDLVEFIKLVPFEIFKKSSFHEEYKTED